MLIGLQYSMFMKIAFILLGAGSSSLIIGLYLLMDDSVYLVEYCLFSIQSEEVVMAILLDWMSLIFMSVVLIISSVIMVYSESYMSADKFKSRFVYLIVLFVSSMIFLIISPNLISILLGWDGLGLISYCLVIYYQNYKSYNAGMLTALSNRLGDVAILLSITWMMNYGSFTYYNYLEILSISGGSKLLLIFVSAAALTKSAQIPFSAWLPAAMAAPTPVSSLVHSSTLVTAGVYLLIRFSYVLQGGTLSEILMVLGVLTMFMSGLGANFESDLKKIVALSTLSQLGLMVGVLGLGYPQLAYFHLLTHALFKALLFMCAGAVIHSAKNYQDLRVMSGVLTMKPLTGACFLVSNLSLCGYPFLAGFYSKDMILEMMSMSVVSMIMSILFFISTGLTVMYTYRLVAACYSGVLSFEALGSSVDGDFYMNLAMSGFVAFSIVGGSSLNWLISPYPCLVHLPLILKLAVLLCVMSGVWLGSLGTMKIYLEYSFTYLTPLKSSFLGDMWFLPMLSTWGISKEGLWLGEKNLKYVDAGWCELFGGSGINYFMLLLSGRAGVLQSYGIKVCLALCMMWLFLMFTLM